MFSLFPVYCYISIQKMNSHLHVECIACLQVWKLCVRKKHYNHSYNIIFLSMCAVYLINSQNKMLLCERSHFLLHSLGKNALFSFSVQCLLDLICFRVWETALCSPRLLFNVFK